MSLLIPLGCRSGPPLDAERRPSTIQSANEVTPVVDEVILIDAGDSGEPSLSPRGDRLIYASAKRPAHKSAQLYERNLNTNEERRITFQNGNASDAQYLNDQTILYSSSTDEEKERFDFLAPKDKTSSKLPEPYGSIVDIYIRHLDGELEIERVSHHPGYDGEPHLQPNRKWLTWTTVDNDRTRIVNQPYPSGTSRVRTDLLANPTNYIESADGRASAWIGWDQGFGVSHLRLRQDGELIEVAPENTLRKSDPTFTPDGRFLIWTERDRLTKESTIWSFERRTRCQQRFGFLRAADRSQPVVTPDLKTLIYRVNDAAGRGRIAQVAFTQRLGLCPEIP